MAQHYNIDNFEHKAIQKIAHGVRAQRYFRGSLKYRELPEMYRETPTERVFVRMRNCNVPSSVVSGGQATIEVHIEPGAGHDIINKIYLVA